MRIAQALLISLLMMLPSLGGCSAIRSAGMAGVGLANSPVPPGGGRESLDSQGFVCDNAAPSVDTFVRFQGAATHVAAFYRRELIQRGWHETKSDETGTVLSYEFSRQSKLGASTYANESLLLRIDVAERLPPTDSPPKVWIWIKGKYAWDFPSELVSQGLFKMLGKECSVGIAPIFFSL